MLKLILENITCHIQREFLIEKGKLTLIKGDSGSGKSSIFQALTGCLYGFSKGLCNFNSTKYSTTLISAEFTIYRRGKPKLLQIVYPNGTVYEDEVAQSMIDQHFGTKDIWNLTCYLQQDHRSILLGGSNSDRMDLLNKLSFWSDNPDYYLERIDTEIKTQQELFKKMQIEYNAECALFTERLTKRMISNDSYLSLEDKNKTNEALTKGIEELRQIETEMYNQNKIYGSLQILNDRYNSITSTIKGYQKVDEYSKEIIELETKIKSNSDKLEETLRYAKNPTDGLANIKSQLESRMLQFRVLLNQKQMIYSEIRSIEHSLAKLINEKIELENNLNLKVSLIPPECLQMGKIERARYYQNIEHEKIYFSGISACNGLGINYNQESINDKIRENQVLVAKINDYKSDIIIMQNINQLQNNILSLKVEGLEPTNDQISELEKQISNMELSQEILVCPHCNKSVRYIGGSLFLESNERVSIFKINESKEQLKIMKSNKEKFLAQSRYITQIDQLRKLLKVNSPDELLSREINNLSVYHNAIQLLHQIKVVSSPNISSENMIKIIEYQEALEMRNKFDNLKKKSLSEQLETYKTKLNDIPDNLEIQIQELNQQLTNIQTNLQQAQKEYDLTIYNLKEEINKLIKSKTILSTKLNEIKYLQDELDKTKVQIEELNTKLVNGLNEKSQLAKMSIDNLKIKLEKAEYYDEMYKWQTKLQTRNDELLTKNKSLGDLYSLKQVAFDLECNHLQMTVDSINESMNDILQDIFEKPIKVILQLYKKNKTNDRIKANVNLNIQYDGNEYDTLDKLSGGEKDRISFALTLALSRINGSPILLLDETLRSLNESYRTLCIDTMKKFLSLHKTILCINHEDVEGNYDNVITL